MHIEDFNHIPQVLSETSLFRNVCEKSKSCTPLIPLGGHFNYVSIYITYVWYLIDKDRERD